MLYKFALAGVAFAGAVMVGSSVASATIIDLNPPADPFLGGSYNQDISSVFDNGRGPAVLARIMHHAGRFCRSDQRSRAGDPSVWIGVRPLLMQRV